MRTNPLLRSLVSLAALALAACAEDARTTQRGIDQDISASYDDGAPTIDNLGQRFAPWRLDMQP
jgi:hypothetical protein